MLKVLTPFVILATSCIGDLFSGPASFDTRPLSLQTLSLFNQRTASRLSKHSWKGDWIFRRERLEMIDMQLRELNPDILLLQELMGKKGSVSESDQHILSAGALTDYSWELETVTEHNDTLEIESLAVAARRSLEFIAHEGRKLWLMGKNGFLMMRKLEFDGKPLIIFNVLMPPQVGNQHLWYSFVTERVRELVREHRICPRRVIVGGYLPGDRGSRRFQEFVSALNLKDVSRGFCQLASRCYTATPTNEIFMATVGDENPERVDRLFVHESALIYTSSRGFAESDSNAPYARRFGLTRLWATQRFGWTASVRLPRCTSDELGVIQ